MLVARRGKNFVEVNMTYEAVRILWGLCAWMTHGPWAYENIGLWAEAGMPREQIDQIAQSCFNPAPPESATAVYTVRFTKTEWAAMHAVIAASAGTDLGSFYLPDASSLIGGVEAEDVKDVQDDFLRLPV